MAAESVVDLGVLQPFYRGMQLQGHLIGMGLATIPDYLLGSDIDLRYRKKPGFAQEIPFVDSFTINRFLGGYREDWLKKYNLWDDQLGLRSLDYAIRKSDGSLAFRPDLIRRRLDPYLSAGYKPQDITLALENVPWDLARKRAGGAVPGPWGQNQPPANDEEWKSVISHFASDLKAYLGPGAALVRFETGVEYDEKVSFAGTASEFYAYYQATDAGLRAVLPSAILSPGEFTGLGECAAGSTNCVYDTADFLRFAGAQGLRPTYVPRSLHAILDKPGPLPSQAAQRAEVSYARLPPGKSEIHQFDLLDEPFGDMDGGDTAALQANWEFQTLMLLWQKLHPQSVYHWNAFDQAGSRMFLNGSGFVRLVLDHYLGFNGAMLPVTATGSGRPAATELMAIGFRRQNDAAIIVSSFSPQPRNGSLEVTVQLPADWLYGANKLRTIRYSGTDNVYALIRADLARAGNLKPEFLECALCLGDPLSMAKDAGAARAMLDGQWPRYEAEMKKSLRWSLDDQGISLAGPVLYATIEPNELLVVEPARSSN